MEQGDYLDILRRRKWMILFSVLIILFGATVYCVLTPDQYLSTVKIRIIPPAVPEGMVRSNADTSTGNRLLVIRQDIRSKPHLLGLINEIGIPTLGFNGMSADKMVQTMRERINVGEDDPKKKQKTDSINVLDPNIFILSFAHENPQVAKDVASRLTSVLVGENIRSREAVTRGTTEFLVSEVEVTRKRLEQQEEKLKRYKLQFSGELPQQEAANLNRLTRLQDQIKSNSDAIARLEDRKILLKSQISTAENAMKGMGSANKGENVEPYDLEESLLDELDVRRMKLEELNTKYTLLHPTAVQARMEIAQLEARIANLRRAPKQGIGVSVGSAADPSTKTSVTVRQRRSLESKGVQSIREQIVAMDLEIAALKRESADASRTIDLIQRKMERLPQREQELVSLTRDYVNIKESYDELLKKKMQSRISEKLEENQKGERFQVLEPANLPTAPFQPERLKVLGLALLASLVIGAGGSIGLEMLDPTLRGPKDFKSLFDIPILACLPVIQDDRSRKRIAIRRAAVVGGLVSILGAYVIFLTLHGEKVLSILQTLGLPIGGKN
jgi:polysaccharide chain length determinant protein (PEP-CTERM system associated)